MREKYLEELLISTIIGALLAVLLCNTLPAIGRGIDFLSLFVIFWIGATAWTWQAIAFGQWIRKRWHK